MKGVILATQSNKNFESITDSPIAFLPIGEEIVIDRLIRQIGEAGVNEISIIAPEKSLFENRYFDHEILQMPPQIFSERFIPYLQSLNDDSLIVNGDLVTENLTMLGMIQAPHQNCIATYFRDPREGIPCVASSDKTKVMDLGFGISGNGESIGVIKLSKAYIKKMVRRIASGEALEDSIGRCPENDLFVSEVISKYFILKGIQDYKAIKEELAKENFF